MVDQPLSNAFFVRFDRTVGASSVSTRISVWARVVALVNVGAHTSRLWHAVLVTLTAGPCIGIAVGVLFWWCFRLWTSAFVAVMVLVT